MIRLFTAIELPEQLRERLAGLGGRIPGARWVPPENMHITLRFIGEVDGGTMADVVEALEEVDGTPFDVTLAETGHFETGRQPHTLWIGVDRNPALIALRDRIESALVRAGLPPESRKFAPHVSIARLKRDAAKGRVAGWLQGNALFRSLPFRVERFVLLSSHLSRSGAIYTPEYEFPLNR